MGWVIPNPLGAYLPACVQSSLLFRCRCMSAAAGALLRGVLNRDINRAIVEVDPLSPGPSSY